MTNEDVKVPGYCYQDRPGTRKRRANPILVWSFYDAPLEYQDLSTHGGDEDWLVFVPNAQALDSLRDESWVRALGCYSVTEHPVSGGVVLIGAHA